jgi:NTE family protein
MGIPDSRMTARKQPKVAVVLSGGAAYGFAHLGVLKGLEEMGLKPSMIVGTSMGAIVGSLYAYNPDADWVYNQIKPYTDRWYLKVVDVTNPREGFMKGHTVEKELRNVIHNAKFSELKLPLIVNATDLRDGKDVAFSRGNVADAVRASISVPLLIKPVFKKKQILVDGGLTDNTFFRILIPHANEYDLFVIVHFRNKIRRLKDNYSFKELVYQVYSIMQTQQTQNHFRLLELDRSKAAKEFRKKMVVVCPDVSGLWGTDFEKIDLFWKKGYQAFRKSRSKIFPIINKIR